MIEETQRDYVKNVEDTLDIDQGVESIDTKDLIQSQQSFDAKLPQESEVKVSRFFIELFICSLLLWSLLFMNQSAYGIRIMGSVEQILHQEIKNEQVQSFVKELEEAIRQIL